MAKNTKAANKNKPNNKSRKSTGLNAKKSKMKSNTKRQNVTNKKKEVAKASQDWFLQFKSRFNKLRVSFSTKVLALTNGQSHVAGRLILANKWLTLSLISLLVLVLGVILPWYKMYLNFNILNVDSKKITVELSGRGINLNIEENLLEPITNEVIDKLNGARAVVIVLIEDEIENILNNLRLYSSLTNPNDQIGSNIITNINSILNNGNINSDTSNNSVIDLQNIIDQEVENLNKEIEKIQTENEGKSNDVINSLIQKLINSKSDDLLELIDTNLSNLISKLETRLDSLNNEQINREINTKYDFIKWISLTLVGLSLFVVLLILIAKYFEYKAMLKSNIFINVLVIIVTQINLIVVVLLIIIFIALITSLQKVDELLTDISLINVNFTLGAGIVLIGISAITIIVSAIVNSIENYKKIQYTKHNAKQKKY